MHVNSEASLIAFNRAYSQRNVYRIATTDFLETAPLHILERKVSFVLPLLQVGSKGQQLVAYQRPPWQRHDFQDIKIFPGAFYLLQCLTKDIVCQTGAAELAVFCLGCQHHEHEEHSHLDTLKNKTNCITVCAVLEVTLQK